MARLYSLSAMTRLHHVPDRVAGGWRRQLDMGRITDHPTFPDFAALEAHVLGPLRYPETQSDKLISYAWVPALYEWSTNVGRQMEEGCWRSGEHECHDLSCHYA